MFLGGRWGALPSYPKLRGCRHPPPPLGWAQRFARVTLTPGGCRRHCKQQGGGSTAPGAVPSRACRGAVYTRAVGQGSCPRPGVGVVFWPMLQAGLTHLGPPVLPSGYKSGAGSQDSWVWCQGRERGSDAVWWCKKGRKGSQDSWVSSQLLPL